MISALLISALLCAEPNYSAMPPTSAPKDGLQFLREAFAKNGEIKVGDWASYRLGVPGRKPKFWRIAAVGTEKDAKGRDANWYEIEAGEHSEFRAPLIQMKMLIAREAGFDMRGMTRLIVQVGASRPQEVTQNAIDEAAAAEAAKPPPRREPRQGDPTVAPKMKTGAPTRVMTLAGTVTAVPIEFSIRNTVIKRLWMSDQIPIIHIAKLELPGIDYSVEVRDFGIDARPRVLMPTSDTPKIEVGDVEKYLSTLGAQEAEDDASQQNTP